MREMTGPEIQQFIRHNRTGILGLADGGRAYCIPLYYAYDGKHIYVHTRPGLKQKFAVATSEACFVIVRSTTMDTWASVQLFGDLERIEESLSAMDALMRVPLPPDWGETPRGEPQRTDEDIALYRLKARRVSGRYSDTAPVSAEAREIAFGGM